jgi:hypothetical protein
MAGLIRMSLDSPEETRPFEGGTGQLQLVDMKEGGVGRATFLPRPPAVRLPIGATSFPVG